MKPTTSDMLERLKTSIEFSLDDEEFKNNLVSYMEATSRYENDMPILEGRVN